MSSTKSILICATQRSGSTLLFDDIRNTYDYPGGESEVLFNKVKSGRYLDWEAAWEHCRAKNSMGNYFIGNVMFHYLPFIDDCIAGRGERARKAIHSFKPAECAAFYEFFKNAVWIYLEREDPYAQAASMYIAQTTKVWARRRDTPAECGYTEPQLEYDYAGLKMRLTGFKNEKGYWRSFFRHFRIAPLRLSYEQVVNHYPHYLQLLLSRIDLEPRAQAPERRTIKQGGPVAQRLSDQLREDIDRERAPQQSTHKRICLVTTEFHGLFKNGGIGTSNTGLARALAAAGHNVTVAYASANYHGPRLHEGDFDQLRDQYAVEGITLDYTPLDFAAPAGFDDFSSTSYCVFRYLLKNPFDIVFFNDCGAQGYYSLLAKHTDSFPNPPLMFVVAHGPLEWVHELNALPYDDRTSVSQVYCERRCLELADLFISPSRYLIDWMYSRGWTIPPHARVLQNIVPVEGVAAETAAVPGLKAVNEIVFFGRLEIRKGLELFCDAIDLLEKAVDLSAVRITFMGKFGKVGAVHSGVYVVERAQRWRAATRIVVAFDQQKALSYLGGAGALAVIPSVAENSPCVVSECLQLGIPFLATGTGGTPELIAPEDREHCLFDPTPAALMEKLRGVLESGQRAGRPAIQQENIIAAWQSLVSTHGRREDTDSQNAGTEPRPLVSVCLAVTDSGASARACLDSILRQEYDFLEVLQVQSNASDLGLDRVLQENGGRIGCKRIVPDAPLDHAAARNRAAAEATGKYLLFVNEQANVLAPGCVAALVAAAERTTASVVTSLSLQGAGRGTPKLRSDAKLNPLPIGACLEVAAFENCFGEGVILVERTRFLEYRGFEPAEEISLEDWLFLSSAALSGLSIEVVPLPQFWHGHRPMGVLEGFKSVQPQRRILEVFGRRPFSQFRHVTETVLPVNQINLPEIITQLGKQAAELALKLSATNVSARDTNQLFYKYCIERGRAREALDFVQMNEVSLLGEALEVSRLSAGTAALAAVISSVPEYRCDVPLTEVVRERINPVGCADEFILEPLADGVGSHRLSHNIQILKAIACGPPGVVSLAVELDASVTAQVAVVLSRPLQRLWLSEDGTMNGKPLGWSGWVTLWQPGRPTRIIADVSSATSERLDLFFLTRLPPGEKQESTGIVRWHRVTASVSVNGARTPSLIELPPNPVLLSAAARASGILLTDVSEEKFSVLRLGDPILLHPLPGRPAIMRIASALQPGSKGVRCFASVGHEQAHDIEFGVWLRPSSARVTQESELAEASFFSGWRRVTDRLKPNAITVIPSESFEEEQDLYLGTRVPDHPDVHYCWAYWHDIFTLE